LTKLPKYGIIYIRDKENILSQKGVIMKNLEKLFNELRVSEIQVSKRKGAKVISQKQLSTIKQSIMNAIVNDIKEVLSESEFVGINENGIVIEIMNDQVDSLSFEMNPKIKGLEFDAYDSVLDFNMEQEAKRERAAQRKKDAKAKFTNAQAQRKTTAK